MLKVMCLISLTKEREADEMLSNDVLVGISHTSDVQFPSNKT